MIWDQLFKFLTGLLTKKRLEASGPVTKHLGQVSRPLGSGYSAPQPPAGAKESRDLKHCVPELVRRYQLVKADFERETGKGLFETCTWRSVEKQQELYAQGRSKPGKMVTRVDGVTKKSRHNVYPSEAVDVCVDSDPGPGKVAVWDCEAYKPLGPICKRHGLEWGGDWLTFKDYPHMQLPANWAYQNGRPS